MRLGRTKVRRLTAAPRINHTRRAKWEIEPRGTAPAVPLPRRTKCGTTPRRGENESSYVHFLIPGRTVRLSSRLGLVRFGMHFLIEWLRIYKGHSARRVKPAAQRSLCLWLREEKVQARLPACAHRSPTRIPPRFSVVLPRSVVQAFRISDFGFRVFPSDRGRRPRSRSTPVFQRAIGRSLAIVQRRACPVWA